MGNPWGFLSSQLKIVGKPPGLYKAETETLSIQLYSGPSHGPGSCGERGAIGPFLQMA